MKRAVDWLRAFLFRLVPASSLGAMRVGLGLLLLATHLLLWPDLELLLGPDGVLTLDNVQRAWTPYRFSLYDWPADARQLHLLHAAGALVLALYTVGLGGAVTRWAAFLVVLSVHHRNPWMQNGGDRVLRIMAFYLALAPCHRALSLDAWLLDRRDRARGLVQAARPLVPVFFHRLIQAQVIVVYAYTGLAKTGGRTWREGSALYYALSDEYYARAPALLDPILADPLGQLVARLSTWVTLAWELLFAPLVLWAPTRPLVLGLGVVLHTGIWATMSVGMFSFAMVWAYQTWLRPDWVERLAARLRR